MVRAQQEFHMEVNEDLIIISVLQNLVSVPPPLRSAIKCMRRSVRITQRQSILSSN